MGLLLPCTPSERGGFTTALTPSPELLLDMQGGGAHGDRNLPKAASRSVSSSGEAASPTQRSGTAHYGQEARARRYMAGHGRTMITPRAWANGKIAQPAGSVLCVSPNGHARLNHFLRAVIGGQRWSEEGSGGEAQPELSHFWTSFAICARSQELGPPPSNTVTLMLVNDC